MIADDTVDRPPHAPDVGFISRGSVFALCKCGALQIVDPARTRHARSWLQELGWSRPPTTLASPDDGWLCPDCTKPAGTRPATMKGERNALRRWQDEVVRLTARAPGLPVSGGEFRIEDVPALLALVLGLVDDVQDYDPTEFSDADTDGSQG